MCQRCRTQDARLRVNESEVRRLARQIAGRQQKDRPVAHLVDALEDAKKYRDNARSEPPVECEDLKNGVSQICAHPGCDRSRYIKGLCQLHYDRQFCGRDMETGKSHARR
jgi:hypothetical protein